MILQRIKTKISSLTGAKRKRLIFSAAGLTGLLLLLPAVALLCRPEPKKAAPAVDPMAVVWQGSLPAESPSATGIRIPGYKSITLKADADVSPVSLVNPKNNPCYFVIRLVLVAGEQRETVFESGLVAPGRGFYQIALNRRLKAGMYQACLEYDAYSLTAKERMNGAAVRVTLIVK